MEGSLKVQLDVILPGVWHRDVMPGRALEGLRLPLFYFYENGTWKRQRQLDGNFRKFTAVAFGSERYGGWTLKGDDSAPVLHMRLHRMDAGIIGEIGMPLRKTWELMERLDPVPLHRFELDRIENTNSIIMTGINSVLDGEERWTRLETGM